MITTTTINTTTQQLPCLAPGCRAMRLASTYSTLCPGHRTAQARHGHALQGPITLAHLEPFLGAVRGYRKRNPDSPAWAILAARWGTLATRARDILSARDAGKPFIKLEAVAAGLLLQVADTVDPQEVITMALAVYLLRDAEPSRFADERAFRFVLCRRVRKLAPTAVGTYWSQKARRVTKVYRDPAPRVTMILGDWLVECFGPAGLQLAALERQRSQEKAREGARLGAALEALQ